MRIQENGTVKANNVGRPSKYKDEYCEQAEKLARLGVTDKEMAEFFGVTVQMLNKWETDKYGNKTPFFESLRRGRREWEWEISKKIKW